MARTVLDRVDHVQTLGLKYGLKRVAVIGYEKEIIWEAEEVWVTDKEGQRGVNIYPERSREGRFPNVHFNVVPNGELGARLVRKNGKKIVELYFA